VIAKGGRAFVGLGLGATCAALLAYPYAALALACMTVFFVFVFRDPQRSIGDGIVAPADGVVREVDKDKGFVSTYLALRNVHVTRAPIDGVVEKKQRSRGTHAPAFSKRTEHNERLEISLRTNRGCVSIIHMTGAIARRIVPYVEVGQSLGKGEKMGLIRFGSRVDVYLPPSAFRIVAKKGQRLRAGVTPIAEASNGDAE